MHYSDYNPTNREKSKEPKSDKPSWCNGCDANLVSDGQKCEVCDRICGGPRKRRLPFRDRHL